MTRDEIIEAVNSFQGANREFSQELPPIVEAILGEIDEAGPEVVDSLTSNSKTKALSANMGKELKAQVDEKISTPEVAGTAGQILQLDENGDPEWVEAAAVGATYDSAMSDSSTNAIQNKTVKKYVDDNFARQDGSYSALRVGTAENLVGRGSVPASFLFRTSGGSADIGTGSAKITKLEGNSLVWNQLNDNSQTITALNNVTATKNNDGSYTLNGTAEANAWGNLSSSLKLFAGHKYLLMCYGGNIRFASSYTGNFNNGEGAKIVECVTDEQIRLQLGVLNGESYSSKKVYPIVIDLTVLFNGNVPANYSVDDFKADYPLDYYAYNAGEVIPFAAENLVTTGFNQWDEEWEVGVIDAEGTVVWGDRVVSSYIPVIPGQEYYFRVGQSSDSVGRYALYDANKNLVLYNGSSAQSVVIPSGVRYLRFCTNQNYGTTYKNDICINLSWSGYRNGEYEPYEKHTAEIDPASWLDTDGNLIFPYGGMHGTGSAADWAKPEADGYFHKGTRVFERIDLGSLSWQAPDSDNITYANTSGTAKLPGSNNIICGKYVTAEPENTAAQLPDKSICQRKASPNNINVRDSAFAGYTGEQVAAALSGVYAYVELATPVEKELATPVPATYYVNDFGTEAWEPANDDEPYTTPCKAEIAYAMNACDTLRNLPKNYLSKNSAENLLLALQTAGLIDSYTMTYDSETQEYDFVVTLPTQGE